MYMKPGTLLAVILLSMIAVGHVMRIAFGLELIIAGIAIPMWPSALAVIVFAAVAVLVVLESRRVPV